MAMYSFTQELPQLPFDRSRSRYYLRFFVLDRPGILSKITGILGDNDISIASVQEKLWNSHAVIASVLSKGDMSRITSIKVDYDAVVQELLRTGELDLRVNRRIFGM